MRVGGCRNKGGEVDGGCRASQSLLLHFIRQQTHRQSGRDGNRRAAFSDNQHNHSQHRLQRDRKRANENVKLIESDESVKKSKEQRVKKEWSSVEISKENKANKERK